MADETARFSGGEWYVHPDLEGTDAAAFTAAAMLYRVLAGTPPFPTEEELLLRQDMREGHFLPIRFAVPGLNPGLAALVQKALGPVGKKTAFPERLLRAGLAAAPAAPAAALPEAFPAIPLPGEKFRANCSRFCRLAGGRFRRLLWFSRFRKRIVWRWKKRKKIP
uniref:Uncharacterized protein n=1 Tax=uncultured bacterium contig00061 TaxID=1181544 RepID=A0A806JYW0_9BACT|nr:hypothetical protein [uncultured bacterium contig00061]